MEELLKQHIIDDECQFDEIKESLKEIKDKIDGIKSSMADNHLSGAVNANDLLWLKRFALSAIGLSFSTLVTLVITLIK